MMETTIQINCFAGLRKFFTNPVSLRLKLPTTYETVLAKMKEMKPEAAEVLNSCRIAVGEAFVPLKSLMTSDEPLFIIPPSSGG